MSLTIFEKIKSFVGEAGKVIIAVSVLLWFLSSYGPETAMKEVDQKAKLQIQSQKSGEYEQWYASEKLKASYAGQIGRFIEPAIEPIGFDWKIGIALITSFAAREVFVGTISTIYSVGTDDSESTTLQDKLKEQKDKDGKPFFTVARGFSIMVFYAFALQCISTISVAYRETKSWTFVLVQLLYLTVLAYVGSWVVYQILA